MGLIQHVWPWDSQPQEAVFPAPQYAASMGSLLIPSIGLRDLVDGGTWTTWGTAPTLGAGSRGRMVDATAAFGGLQLLPKVNQATAAQTHILLVESTDISGSYAGLATCASADGAQASFAFQRELSDWRVWTSNSVSVTLTANPPTAFGPSILIVTGDGSGWAAYRDGALIGSGSAAISAQANSRLVLFGERAASASYATKARLWLYSHLTRRISDGEAAELSNNPWQLFEPRRIFVPVSVGGGSYTLTAESGSYTLTGQPAGLLASRTLAADAGTYTLTGQDAGLTRGRVMAAEAGSYTLTGVAAVLAASRVMAAEAGSYTLTGVAAVLAASRVLAADAGAYALTGQAVGLTKTTAGAYSLAADPGSYSLNGQAVNLQAARRLVADAGTYALTGQAVGLAKTSGYTITAAAGSYALSGQAVGMARTWLLQLDAGAYALTGRPVVLTYSGEAAPKLTISPLGHRLSDGRRSPRLSTATRPPRTSSSTR